MRQSFMNIDVPAMFLLGLWAGKPVYLRICPSFTQFAADRHHFAHRHARGYTFAIQMSHH
ncbi:hypothetical protein OZL92_06895 [Bacillus sonorensis]|mgnify:CR=1 FL=1|uniref:Uncharacterized protein n=1 Tax=Bacillus sonorensis TaxID=119858 RepID=A0ABM6LC94_9BACI|nr:MULTISPECIES: hypothetical protein [Bacillus]TWK83459.1 hypothetical protein CHCC20335_4530 [Bacillus paralicheniformis]ASB86809.1 hypothetical protein S101395_00254 [Bacillus sonorensis]MBG9914659.1 hypothetical protein [Bacillus sonorensis]MCF7616062.1 hypothetical protein [Bacillus sonorensis]MCY8402639.1 hypothetical protein [Bacillus sonorensis]